ncbi:hypothetical protein CLV40_114128 [Actinokineospora auranticolor]|uniref:Uncharacterized protein n=1 Tax=Actinokineospora auranticolor TaxID=155976 RepID=A0A2S6GJZ5_9PSEU|nr:hypothetical protein CLV40_114128 [Actinokineospora auranticolor]
MCAPPKNAARELRTLIDPLDNVYRARIAPHCLGDGLRILLDNDVNRLWYRAAFGD